MKDNYFYILFLHHDYHYYIYANREIEFALTTDM